MENIAINDAKTRNGGENVTNQSSRKVNGSKRIEVAFPKMYGCGCGTVCARK